MPTVTIGEWCVWVSPFSGLEFTVAVRGYRTDITDDDRINISFFTHQAHYVETFAYRSELRGRIW